MKKLKNATNAFYDSIRVDLKNSTKASDKALFDNVQDIREGEYTVCLGWEAVDRLLTCFDGNDNWDIRCNGSTFFVMPDKASTIEKKRFEQICKEENAR